MPKGIEGWDLRACEQEGDPGEPVIFQHGFPTPDGRGKFVPAEYIHAAELPDPEFPFIFTTGRQLEHWHTGSMTRNATVLNALEPLAVVSIHPDDLDKVGAKAGDLIRIESRRGKVEAKARADYGMQRGTLFMAFCYNEAAANLVTTEELDPFGKIPEFKFCAVRVCAAA